MGIKLSRWQAALALAPLGMGMRCGQRLRKPGPPLTGTLGPVTLPDDSQPLNRYLSAGSTKLCLSSGSTFPFSIHINCRHKTGQLLDKHPHSTRHGTHGLVLYLQERPCGGHATSYAHALVYKHTTIFYLYMNSSVMIKTTESLNPPASIA